jgi:hypothetical protein
MFSLRQLFRRTKKAASPKPSIRSSLSLERLEARETPTVTNPFNIYGYAAQPGYYGQPAFSSANSITPNPGTSGLFGGVGAVLPGYVSNPISNAFLPFARNPVQTVANNVNYLNAIAPGVNRNVNGFTNTFATSSLGAFPSTGGNPFANNYQILADGAKTFPTTFAMAMTNPHALQPGYGGSISAAQNPYGYGVNNGIITPGAGVGGSGYGYGYYGQTYTGNPLYPYTIS